MKSIKLFLLFVCLFTVQVKAQTPVVQMMEGEIRAGLTTPIGGFHTGKAEVGGDIGLEGRYNFEGTPWDCGLMLEVSWE